MTAIQEVAQLIRQSPGGVTSKEIDGIIRKHGMKLKHQAFLLSLEFNGLGLWEEKDSETPKMTWFHIAFDHGNVF